MFHPLKLAREIGLALALAIVVLGTALIGAGWLTYALYQWLSYSFDLPEAAGLTGLIAFVPLVLLAFWVRFHRSEPAREHEPLSEGLMLGIISRATDIVRTLTQNRPLEVIVLVAMAGFALARSPGSFLTLLTAVLGALRANAPDKKEPGT